MDIISIHHSYQKFSNMVDLVLILLIHVFSNRLCHAAIGTTRSVKSVLEGEHSTLKPIKGNPFESIINMRRVYVEDHEHDDMKNPAFNETITIVPSRENQTATAIFLHGFGATGFGLEPVMKNFLLTFVKVICPTSNVIINDYKRRAKLYSWYNIQDDITIEDTPRIELATSYIHHIIECEIKRGIPPSRIVLGGFSQGGTLALHAALTFPKTLGGIIAYSTWFPKNDTFGNKPINPANKDTPILRCNPGRIRNHHKHEHVRYKSYAGTEYSIAYEEMEDIRRFVRKLFMPPPNITETTKPLF